MTLNRNDSQFSSKELNKILPSYILEEIDKEHSELQKPNINKKVSLIFFYFNLFYYRIYQMKLWIDIIIYIIRC
jgi:hypothetical protein